MSHELQHSREDLIWGRSCQYTDTNDALCHTSSHNEEFYYLSVQCGRLRTQYIHDIRLSPRIIIMATSTQATIAVHLTELSVKTGAMYKIDVHIQGSLKAQSGSALVQSLIRSATHTFTQPLLSHLCRRRQHLVSDKPKRYMYPGDQVSTVRTCDELVTTSKP